MSTSNNRGPTGNGAGRAGNDDDLDEDEKNYVSSW